MASLTPAPKAQFFDANGNPLVGGKLYSYAAGTTTPLATYVDQTQTATNTNPVILDSRGEASVWLAVASYKLRLTDANNVEIWTVDNIVTDDVAVLSDLALPGGATLVGYSPGPDSLLGVVPMTVKAALDELSDKNSGSSVVGFRAAGINGTAQAGAASTITLAASSSATDDAYNGWTVEITSGTGAGQVRTISDYVGTTKVATVSTAWTTTPNATSVYNIAYPRTAQSKMRDVVSVKDFGAVGNGSADDTAAIQAAIDYCAVAGGEVYIPAATYYCASGLDLKALVSIRGDGYEASILQFDHTGYGLKFETASVNTNDLWGGKLSGFSVRNSNVSNTDGGIVMAGASQGMIENVRVGRFKYALILDQANILNVTNCYFLSALTANVWLTNGPDYRAGASTGFTNRISIDNCQFNGPQTMPWHIIDDGGQNHIIYGNNINAGAKSVRFASVAGLTFSNNEIEGNDGAYQVEFRNTTYSGTTVNACRGVTVENNVNSANSSVLHCFYLEYLTGGNFRSNRATTFQSAMFNLAADTVRDCTFENNTKNINGTNRTQYPLYIGSTNRYKTNAMLDVAQAYVVSGLSAGANTVTPTSMQGIQLGDTLYAINDDGTNGEFVKVKSLTSTTFDANFASNKAANWTLMGQSKPTRSFYASNIFTPTIAGTSTAGTGTYTTQEGRYTQIGNRVFFDLNIVWTAHTGTGNMIVSGLPVLADLNALKAACASSYNTLAVGSGKNLVALVDNGTANILLYAADPAGSSIAALAMDTAGSIRLAGSYEV